MADFKSLLSKPMDEIERPKPLPAGTYVGRIVKYDFAESQEKKTPYLRYTVQPEEVGDDVSPEDLAGVDMTKKQLRKDFYLTNDAMYRLKEFLESCGIDVTGRSLGEAIPESRNARVLMGVVQRPSQDGTEVYNEIRDFKGLE